MRKVTDLLVGGRSYRLHRNGREASKSSRVFNELVLRSTINHLLHVVGDTPMLISRTKKCLTLTAHDKGMQGPGPMGRNSVLNGIN